MTSNAEFAQALRFRRKRVLWLAGSLLLITLLGRSVLAEEKFAYPFATLGIHSAVWKYFNDFRMANLGYASTDDLSLLDWKIETSRTITRTFESLGVELFAKRPERFSRFEPGIGKFFEDDTIGRSRISGAGWEENRWLFLKVKFQF